MVRRRAPRGRRGAFESDAVWQHMVVDAGVLQRVLRIILSDASEVKGTYLGHQGSSSLEITRAMALLAGLCTCATVGGRAASPEVLREKAHIGVVGSYAAFYRRTAMPPSRRRPELCSGCTLACGRVALAHTCSRPHRRCHALGHQDTERIEEECSHGCSPCGRRRRQHLITRPQCV
jgi:hypothetical protein